MRLSIGRVATAVTLAAGLALIATPALASSSPATHTALSGERPVWATASRAVGRVSGSSSRTFQVNLVLRNAAGAEQFAAEVSNPKSSMYGRYLTPKQFDARYSPTAARVAAIEKWLQASGFKVDSVPSNNRYVEASGTVAKIDKTFATTLEWYSIEGHRYAAPAAAPSVPTNLVSGILAVTGLDDGADLTRPDNIGTSGVAPLSTDPTATSPVKVPCSHYYGQHVAHMPKAYGVGQFPTYICGYTATQLEGAYGVGGAIGSGNDGAGVTVAITDAYASPTILSDAQAFSSLEHVAPFTKGQFTQVLPKSFNLQSECGSWSLEETLDVEAVHTMAPGAKIVYVAGQNCAAGLGEVAINEVVAKHLANIVTDSWSDGTENVSPRNLAAEHAIFVQGAAEGIGFNFSTGDNGDLLAATGETQPSVPASDPEVTAVGGTSLAVGASNEYLSETGWGNDIAQTTGSPAPGDYTPSLPGFFYAGAGGGTSHVFAEPSYQDGVVPSGLADEYGSAARVVPDVSAVADPFTGFLEVETIGGKLTSFDIGGTSVASPTFAGLEALASQGRSTPIGFANPLLYSVAGTSAFHDITPTVDPIALAFSQPGPDGNLDFLITQDHDSSLQTTAGYDNVTGIGTPNGEAFLKALG